MTFLILLLAVATALAIEAVRLALHDGSRARSVRPPPTSRTRGSARPRLPAERRPRPAPTTHEGPTTWRWSGPRALRVLLVRTRCYVAIRPGRR